MAAGLVGASRPRPANQRVPAPGGPLTGATVELTIERVAHGGVCVGRGPDGRVVFVRHTLPGERVRAVVTEEHDRYLRADAVEIVEPAPDRVAAPCPHAGPGRCGGCDWQHVDLAAQRALKAAVVREQLSRLAGIEHPVVVEALPDASPARGPGLGWRTRVGFAVRPDGVAGLHRHRSHEVEPLDDCPLTHPAVRAAEVLAQRWPAAGRVDVTVAVGTGDRRTAVTPRRGGRPRADRAFVVEEAAGRPWRVTGDGFWQVHPAAADALTAAVLDALAARPGDRVLDLYAGVGLFARALAAPVGPGGSLVAVESDAQAAADARANLAGLPVEVREGRVERELAGAGAAMGGVDLVVLDPPRAGAGARVMRAIAALRPRRTAYVSCDPATLARDVATAHEAGLEVAAVRAFDLFPMTAHVECLVTLVPVGTR